MKKIIISMMAVAALAACTKSEVQYEPAGEIAFAPVAKNVTKSVAGYSGGTFDGVFPTDINLYVFANASNDAGTAWEDPYFENAKFVWDAAKGTEDSQTFDGKNYDTEGAYAGDPTRYWPNVKTLKFAGYSDACGVEKNATMDFANNVLTIPAYTQDNENYTAKGANDLMWFSRTEAYSKQSDEIAAQMRHACSWITINVAGDDVTANNWTLNSLVVKTLKHSGSVVCGGATASWTLTVEKTDEVYYNDGTTFTKEYVKYEKTANNFIVLPQTPTSLDVTYTYTSQEAIGTKPAITLTETKNVPLTLTNSLAVWSPGVHYIYNVMITATEILIDPVVVDWTNYAGNDIAKEVN